MSQTPLADEMARISKEEFNRYLADFRPLEQKTIDSLDESTVGTAMGNSQADSVRAQAALGRMRERYGTGTTPMQQAGEQRKMALSGALGTLNAGNTAYLADRDRVQSTRAGLMNVGQQLRQQSLGNYSSAAGMEGARTSADAQNSASYKQSQNASKQQTYATVASLGMMAAMVM